MPPFDGVPPPALLAGDDEPEHAARVTAEPIASAPMPARTSRPMLRIKTSWKELSWVAPLPWGMPCLDGGGWSWGRRLNRRGGLAAVGGSVQRVMAGDLMAARSEHAQRWFLLRADV